MFHLQVKRLK